MSNETQDPSAKENTMSNETQKPPTSGEPTASATPAADPAAKPAAEKAKRKAKVKSAKEKSHYVPAFESGAVREEGEEILGESAGNTNPAVVADADDVRAGIPAVLIASGVVAAAQGQVDLAVAAWKAPLAVVATALASVADMLVRVIPGGDRYYRRNRVRDPWQTALNLVATYSESNLVAPGDVAPAMAGRYAALEAAVNQAQQARKGLEDARAKEEAAVRAYSATKRDLELAIQSLRSSLKRAKWSQARSGGTQVGPGSPLPSAPVGGSGAVAVPGK